MRPSFLYGVAEESLLPKCVSVLSITVLKQGVFLSSWPQTTEKIPYRSLAKNSLFDNTVSSSTLSWKSSLRCHFFLFKRIGIILPTFVVVFYTLCTEISMTGFCQFVILVFYNQVFDKRFSRIKNESCKILLFLLHFNAFFVAKYADIIKYDSWWNRRSTTGTS